MWRHGKRTRPQTFRAEERVHQASKDSEIGMITLQTMSRVILLQNIEQEDMLKSMPTRFVYFSLIDDPPGLSFFKLGSNGWWV